MNMKLSNYKLIHMLRICVIFLFISIGCLQCCKQSIAQSIIDTIGEELIGEVPEIPSDINEEDIGRIYFPKVNKVKYNDSDLTNRKSKRLIVRSNFSKTQCFNKRIKSAELNVLFNLGEDYNYVKNKFTSSVQLRIRGYASYPHEETGAAIINKLVNLEIDENTPEKLFNTSFSVLHKSINRFEIEVLHYDTNPTRTDIDDDIHLEVFYTEEFAVDVETDSSIITVEPIISPSASNLQAFRWKTSCPGIPNYQFQLLRLYSLNPRLITEDPSTPPYPTLDTEIFAHVDWSKALTIETESSATFLTLTIAEGTGYYIWRVRPIGNYFEGSIANDANWGVWSDAPNDGDSIQLSASDSNPWAFFYRQFDDDKNWIYSRTFTEGNKISEQITYANGLFQVKQNQKRLQSEEKILVNQTIYDYSGRPAINSMAAPVASNALGYVNKFMRNGSYLYSAEHFDDDYRYKNPAPANRGALSAYYSNENPDINIPIAEGYPFTQTLYYKDGTSRVKELGGVGETHRIKRDNSEAESRTVKTYYASTSDEELISIFGDEAPKATSVSKVITMDQNKTATVAYKSASRDTLATCLALSDGNTDLLEPLPSRPDPPNKTTHTITENTYCGEGCFESRAELTFTKPTDLTLDYRITPNKVEDLCTDSSQSCDYTVYISINRKDEPDDPMYPKFYELNVDTTAPTFRWSEKIFDVQPGSYQVNKRVFGYNINPESTTTENPSGETYRDEQVTNLSEVLESETDTALEEIYGLLNDSNLDGLYEHLGVSEDDDSDSTTVNTGCCTIEIPIKRCEANTCPEDRNFERHFEEVWQGTSYVEPTSDGKLKYLPNYAPEQFNELIINMENDPYTPYDCDEIWQCWDALVRSYGSMKDMVAEVNNDSDPTNDLEYDLLEQFLNCSGLRLRGYTDNRFGDFENPGYLSHAYAYFEYTPGNNENCENIFPEEGRSKVLNSFYLCVKNTPEYSSEEALDTRARKTIGDLVRSCKNICESRTLGLLLSLMKLYTDMGLDIPDDITWEDIICRVQMLIDRCKEGCNLSVEESSIFIDGTWQHRIRRVGTEEEIQRMRESMSYSYELSLPRRSLLVECPNGFELLQEDVDSTDILVLYLNTELDKFRATLDDTRKGRFNYIEALTEFFPLRSRDYFTKPSTGVCFQPPEFEEDKWTVLVSSNVPSKFIINDTCQLAYQIMDPENEQIIELKILCNEMCLGSTSCPICFRWVSPVKEAIHEFTPVSCEQQAAAHIKNIIQQQVATCIGAKRDELLAEYHNQCLRPDSIDDRLTLTYDQGYYHYTLFYYDRAGNLIRTVSPKGVDEKSAKRNQHPKHTYVTEYEYNSLGQRIKQKTPDAGVVKYYYDNLGQLRFSQNDKQNNEGTYAYTMYDYLGRVVETGKSSQEIANFYTHDNLKDEDFPDSTHDKSEVVTTVYSKEHPSLGRQQDYLQNRVSYMVIDDDGNPGTAQDRVSKYFSYDPHGNVKWMGQEALGIETKYIDYEYDLISRNVLKIKYNAYYESPDLMDKMDTFYHRYCYDADNRLIQVETSRDGKMWDRDARYEYYAHGPLMRIILGEDRVQGIDYTYTIHGWLKGINHPDLLSDVSKDPGQDGINDGLNSTVGKDAFGMALTYYNGDFVKDGSPFKIKIDDTINEPTHLAPFKELYNGFITSLTSNIAPNKSGLVLKYEKLVGVIYYYDEVGRLLTAFFEPYDDDEGWQHMSKDYGAVYKYDANGNIERLTRTGYAPRGIMDNLAYEYNLHTNRLNCVKDRVADDRYDNDIDNQTENNYAYDEIGNLIKDDSEDIERIDWSLYGKVKQIIKSNGDIMAFLYDPTGNRIGKMVIPRGESQTKTYYVRDANGQIMAMYSGKHDDRLTIDMPIYGSDRLGMHRQKPGTEKTSAPYYERTLGNKVYELKDHLGNIRVTLSDIKQNESGKFTADLLSYRNYYPFGSLMPDRTYKAETYHFGFNGMEKDDEVKGSGNSYTTLFRQYDPRVGRWLSIDPKGSAFPAFSPYNGLGNNPVIAADPNGGIPTFVVGGILGGLTSGISEYGRAQQDPNYEFWWGGARRVTAGVVLGGITAGIGSAIRTGVIASEVGITAVAIVHTSNAAAAQYAETGEVNYGEAFSQGTYAASSFAVGVGAQGTQPQIQHVGAGLTGAMLGVKKIAINILGHSEPIVSTMPEEPIMSTTPEPIMSTMPEEPIMSTTPEPIMSTMPEEPIMSTIPEPIMSTMPEY